LERLSRLAESKGLQKEYETGFATGHQIQHARPEETIGGGSQSHAIRQADVKVLIIGATAVDINDGQPATGTAVILVAFVDKIFLS
jgi:hypothetical protein